MSLMGFRTNSMLLLLFRAGVHLQQELLNLPLWLPNKYGLQLYVYDYIKF